MGRGEPSAMAVMVSAGIVRRVPFSFSFRIVLAGYRTVR